MQIKKALITAAGFGTRFLPISKTIQKEMLPILNRPMIDYVVSDCVSAGIEEIVFVASEHNKQLLHFYSENARLFEYLKKMGKLPMYDKIANLHKQVKFSFIKQSDSDQYGTAVPVRLAKEQLQNEEAFLVFMGDDFIYNEDGESEAKKMMQAFGSSGAAGLATCIRKPKVDLSRYGVADIVEKNGLTFLKKIIEKPTPGTEPSDLINISKYVLTPQIFEVIAHQELNQATGELYITDSVTTLAQQSTVVVHIPDGRYLDGGNVLEWLKANIIVAKNQKEMLAELTEFVKTEFGV
jgi:UTP--glucose-1-phosphate uridylyltransferase